GHADVAPRKLDLFRRVASRFRKRLDCWTYVNSTARRRLGYWVNRLRWSLPQSADPPFAALHRHYDFGEARRREHVAMFIHGQIRGAKELHSRLKQPVEPSVFVRFGNEHQSAARL